MGVLEPGRFVVDREIGRGGFAVVYLAHDRQHGDREVAIKACPLEPSGHETPTQHASRTYKMKRLEREASFGWLIHPNIVRFYDSGQWEYSGKQHFAIVQEYLAGINLKAVVDLHRGSPEAKSQWPRHKVLGDLARACEGVAYMHENGVCDRDIKPDNIRLVRDYTRAKKLDIGLAKSLGETHRGTAVRPRRHVPAADDPTLTTEGTVAGTPSYMSPEQAQGHKLDARSDVWSLGVVLYEILTLKRPFEADTQRVDVIYKIIDEEAPLPNQRLHRHADRVPADLEGIAMKCLSKDKGNRYPSACELVEDFQSYLQSPKGVLELVPPAGRKRFAPGEIIAKEGDPSTGMYILEKGKGAIVVEKGDRKIPYESGFFGEAALIKPGQPRSATMRAGDAGCELVEVPDEESLLRLIHDSPQIPIDVIRQMHERLTSLEAHYGAESRPKGLLRRLLRW